MDNKELMVTIRCLAYNHEPYIRQCLEGFVMQKTNFRFEAIVHDDASTDGTAAIIREYAEKYPDIIKPIFETENQYSKRNGSIRRIMDEHTHGKYVAMCEGDDYWTDPLKLQKQVDAFNQNLTVTMVHTGFKCIDANNRSMIRPRYENYMRRSYTGDRFADLLLEGNFPLTLTTMFRKEVFESDIYRNCPVSYDYALFLSAAALGDFIYLPEITGCYRYSTSSAMSTIKDTISKYYRLTQCYFVECIKLGKTKKLSYYAKCKIYTHILSNCISLKNRCINNGYRLFYLNNKWLYFFFPFLFFKKVMNITRSKKKYK